MQGKVCGIERDQNIAMIHMLSKFDLNTQTSFGEFEHRYLRFVAAIRDLDLIESAGSIGRRVSDTPMDTAGDQEPEFLTLMSFRDRAQLDAAYEYLLSANDGSGAKISHNDVFSLVANPVFICWQDAS